ITSAPTPVRPHPRGDPETLDASSDTGSSIVTSTGSILPGLSVPGAVQIREMIDDDVDTTEVRTLVKEGIGPKLFGALGLGDPQNDSSTALPPLRAAFQDDPIAVLTPTEAPPSEDVYSEDSVTTRSPAVRSDYEEDSITRFAP